MYTEGCKSRYTVIRVIQSVYVYLLLHPSVYINSTNISQIIIINRIYDKYSVAVAFFLPGRAKDLSAPLYI